MPRPPREYGPTPFWALNDDLRPDRLRRALKLFAERGFAGVFMHARTGLEIEYLSEDWWDRVSLIVEECASLGLKAWIYDEYNWPSGLAGGKTIAGRDDLVMPCLDHVRLKKGSGQGAAHTGRAVAAFSMGHKVADLSDRIEDGKFQVPDGTGEDVLLFFEDKVTDETFATNNAPWVSGVQGYVDLMNPEATGRFMELTHLEYERRLGKYFGDVIPGVFTDEPQFYRAIPWTARFAERFKAEKGYDPMSRLYMLIEDRAEYRRFRQDYYGLAESLCVESYYLPLRQWCDDRGLILTGHLGKEEDLGRLPTNHGGLYGPLSSLTMPGIDALGSGNPIAGGLINMESPNFAPRAAASISRLRGDGSVLCEAGGGSGWEATPSDLKKQLDWLFASGVNFINPHQSLLSAKGLRKRDFPPSHSEQEPWFEFYSAHSEYVARSSMAVRAGEPVRDVALFFPTSAIRASHRAGSANPGEESVRTIVAFTAVLDFLVHHQRSPEIIFEDSIVDGKVTAGNGKLAAGGGEFEFMVLTSASVIRSEAAALLTDFLTSGGKMLVFDRLPRSDQFDEKIPDSFLHEVKRAEEQNRLVQISSLMGFSKTGVLSALERLAPAEVKIESDFAERIILHHSRLEDGDLYFLANLDEEKGMAKISFKNARAELDKWSPVTGKSMPVPFRALGDGSGEADLSFGPFESMILTFLDGKGKVRAAIREANFRVMEIGPKAVKGVGARGEARLQTDSGFSRLELEYPPHPLALGPGWEVVPSRENLLPLGPWKVTTDETSPLPLSGLKDEKYFAARTRLLIRAGRPALGLAKSISPPSRRYRTEKYFDFADVEKMRVPISRITGIDLERLGLYEGVGAINRLADYLGVNHMMKSFPSPGASYRAETVFRANYIPSDLALVFEDLGEPIRVRLNGRDLSEAAPDVRGWDPCCRAYKIARLAKKGKNRVSIISRQPAFNAMSPSTHSIEPAALAGSFQLDEKQKLIEPRNGSRQRGDWTDLGYPFYSGLMTYKRTFHLPEEFMQYFLALELDEVRECARVRLNGQDAGVRLYYPFAFDVSGLARPGENELEVEVANTAANFFAEPMPSGILGPVRIVPYALFEMDLPGKKDRG